MSRHPIDIDPKIVYAMALVGSTNVEIAEVCGCSENVIRARFGDILTKAHGRRKNKLRRRQWKAAMQGNVVMMIWLGKQMLGQKDNMELSGPDKGPIEFEEIPSLMKLPFEHQRAVRAAIAAYTPISKDSQNGHTPAESPSQN